MITELFKFKIFGWCLLLRFNFVQFLLHEFQCVLVKLRLLLGRLLLLIGLLSRSFLGRGFLGCVDLSIGVHRIQNLNYLNRI
jgi:hypothetical protein